MNRADHASLEAAFAPVLAPGEELLQAAVGVRRRAGDTIAAIVLHLLGAGIAMLLFSFAKRYYLVGLTNRRLLIVGVESTRNLTITDRYEVLLDGTAELKFSEAPGRICLSAKTLPGMLEFAPLLLEGNCGRARSLGEALGAFDAGHSSDSPDSPPWPLDSVPFTGLRRARRVMLIGIPLLVVVFVTAVFAFESGFSGLGSSCTDDGSCRSPLFCRKQMRPSGVCTMPCQTAVDCKVGFRCSEMEKACIPADE
jgi:hypothetical protein